MATGSYGTIRPADVSPQDVDIILHYTPSRDETSNFLLTKLDAPSILRPFLIMLILVVILMLKYWVGYIIWFYLQQLLIELEYTHYILDQRKLELEF